MIIKIIFCLYVFIQLRAILTRKVDLNVMFCGLIGYCGSSKPDINMLKLIAIYNDDRGGDSCGIYNNKEVRYGINLSAKFSKLFVNSEFPPVGKEDYTYIMHARKSSVGFQKTAANAHPFLLENTEGEVDFVGAHNGTLRNWRDLCRERDINLLHIDVDSHGLLACIQKDKSFKVLSEYEGGAALLFKDVGKPNQLFAFKGGGGNVEERPLFYYQKMNTRGIVTGVYISSLEESLQAIGAKKEEVITFKNNELISFIDGKIEYSQIIARKGELNTSIPYAQQWSGQSAFSQCDSMHYDSERLAYGASKARNKKVATTVRPINIFVEESGHEDYKGATISFMKFRFFRNGNLLEGGCILDNKTKKDLFYGLTTPAKAKEMWDSIEDKTNKQLNWYHNGVCFKTFDSYIQAKTRCPLLSKSGAVCTGVNISALKPTHPVSNIVKNKGKKKRSYTSLNSYYYHKDGEVMHTKDYTYTNPFTPWIYKIKGGCLSELIDKKDEETRKNRPNILDAYDNVTELKDIEDSDEFSEQVANYFDDAIAVLLNFKELQDDEDIKFIYRKVFEFVYTIYSHDIIEPDMEDLEILIELEEKYKKIDETCQKIN